MLRFAFNFPGGTSSYIFLSVVVSIDSEDCPICLVFELSRYSFDKNFFIYTFSLDILCILLEGVS